MFDPLRSLALRLSQSSWPARDELTQLARQCDRGVVNTNGRAIQFVEPSAGARSGARYEQDVADAGKVAHRGANWHDLFNALVWMTFPLSKAGLNARHIAERGRDTAGKRTPTAYALTQFDEDGVVVASEQPDLLELLRTFQWRQLFWQRRREVERSMRWLVFGHAQYEKGLQPFVGLTAKALTLLVKPGFNALSDPGQIALLDRAVADSILDSNKLASPRAFAPVPVLGIPGWWAENERESFYDNHNYFRPGRRSTAPA